MLDTDFLLDTFSVYSAGFSFSKCNPIEFQFLRNQRSCTPVYIIQLGMRRTRYFIPSDIETTRKALKTKPGV